MSNPVIIFSSTHESYDYVKNQFKSSRKGCIRFGSCTPYKCDFEINPIKAIETCVDKKLTKEAFDKAGVQHSEWRWSDNPEKLTTMVAEMDFPIIAKRRTSSQSLGVYKLDDFNAFEKFIEEHNCEAYIFEEYLGYAKEVRIYISKDFGYIAGLRKMRVRAKDDGDWKPNDKNSIWIHEVHIDNYRKKNEAFEHPDNWLDIIEDCQKAIKVIGMDICCFDIKLQGNTNAYDKHRKNPKWALLEANSAGWMSGYLKQKYLEILPKIIALKEKN